MGFDCVRTDRFRLSFAFWEYCLCSFGGSKIAQNVNQSFFVHLSFTYSYVNGDHPYHALEGSNVGENALQLDSRLPRIYPLMHIVLVRYMPPTDM